MLLHFKFIQMKNCNPFVLLGLLLIRVVNIQAGCSWDSNTLQKYCTISCKSTGMEATDDVLADLEQKFREVDNQF